MGWLWTSSPAKEEPQPSSSMPSLSSSSTPQPSPTTENTSTTTTPPPPSQSRPLSREEIADAEFNQLLESLKADVSRTKSSQPHSQTAETSSQTPNTPQPPASIAPESLYPDTMSCRSAFDYAFFCQSFGGQFVNVYRYGELRSCSEHWDNFWLCMKTRRMADEERKKVIRDHYRKKAVKYKTGASSEDVWDLRGEPVEDAFQGDFAALEREMKAEEEANRKAGGI
ncbi:EMI1 family protein [Aspergillus clavatus NRRL 1]|uniref:Early meiotic induction protein 1 n=1 Tax=Aspergillus clavatus (strain ATCC 1007 / CBS 513.65 / DSM 816 / NCTC 3887 / NRRL 1 / QM 1276 / 107) TaxID=344612 RepID=A1CQT0_ASPCL|nr:uncharacterized protein ACLA_027230 [Aspergillus clavatus NRRL 1]EAW08001.1 conserved hypothetical protein [Aspergillus clavatus NRRL 1]